MLIDITEDTTHSVITENVTRPKHDLVPGLNHEPYYYPLFCIVFLKPNTKTKARLKLNHTKYSLRLGRESNRNIELIWLTERLVPGC